ncbi:hypothetical protein FFWV33_14615 [Flavobacterium faecale]|uniref:HTH luxR-type domain-containing protein n=1 Tax=Flavobacterium faecale TaxID=1355330 RepID=A0A2S1LFV9_9FLAO|nr:hypothetical protein [Flavobacterium faecale]AWG22672.1 hypothetical protein FFWV33_14615 [Flavobacterium faecale]
MVNNHLAVQSNNKKHIFQILFFFLPLLLIIVTQDVSGMKVNLANKTPLESISTDTIVDRLSKSLSLFKSKKNTPKIIDTHQRLVQYYLDNGSYNNAFDEIWKLLPLVASPEYAEQRFEITNKLIGLYLLYGQNDKAIASYKQLPDLVRKQITNPEKKIRFWGRIYSLGAWIELKTTKNYSKAAQLSLKSNALNSQLKDGLSSYHHTQIQLAHIYILMGNLQKAAPILQNIQDCYPLPLQSIHALLYFRLGQFYEKGNKTDLAIASYKTSLTAIGAFRTLQDKKPEAILRLSELYAQKGDFQLAFKYQKEASLLNDQLFSATKSQNNQLFEIKNKYQEQLKEDQATLQQHQMVLLAKENQLLILKTVFLILMFIVAALFIIRYFKQKAKKELLSQSQINHQQRLELKQQHEILELKNKELLSTALQLLERDNWQADVKKELGKLTVDGANADIVKKVKSSLQIDTKQKWNEFESRFATINDAYIEKLKSSYPLLTPTDLKMCSFIKLGFSTKDMSQIMGISAEGINTSRSRLRKKMDLDRNINLIDFLQSING